MRLIDQILQIFLESCPGTKKAKVLASQVTYLLRTKQRVPQTYMVVLSFTKRDANALKEKAFNMPFDGQHNDEARNECNKMLWSGIIHYFAKKYLKNVTVTVTLTLHCEAYPPEKCEVGLSLRYLYHSKDDSKDNE